MWLSNLKSIVGAALVFASIFDAWKYVWNSQAIIRNKSAKAHSRKSANAALTQDIIKLFYGILICDLFIILSSLLALGTMSYYWYTIYLYYPYRKRGLSNFRRPNIILYLMNSLIPNRIRRRL